MSLICKNIFDLKIIHDGTVTILVETEKRNMNQLQNLIHISKIPCITMFFTPTENADKRELLKDTLLINYEASNGIISANIKINKTIQKSIYLIDTQSKIHISDKSTLNKIFVSQLEPYFYVTNKSFSFDYKTYISPNVNYEEFLDQLRILLTTHKYFYPYFNLKINEGYYISYRTHSVFYNYQKNWSFVCQYDDNKNMQHILSSMSTRLNMISRAIDKISLNSFMTPNNDTLEETLYHFGYFIMLITGVFDDLASYINQFYDMQLKKREFGLRNIRDTKKFFSKLKQKDNELYGLLTDSNTQNAIKAFYPLRNNLQHNDFSTGMTSGSSNQKEPNIILIPSTSYQLNKTRFDDKELGFILTYDDSYVLCKIYPFSLSCMKTFQKIVNNILDSIDLKWKYEQQFGKNKFEKDNLNKSGYNFENSMYFDSYWLQKKND